ncbi:hypothetical protein N7462_003074 [Penicillium macrosclerotiorum]|uniref:uncharacterized protein n=1 Tax=Penicillium macrosclerotiorum TaxID=303699 RepID=UPI002549AEA1|nr:uncharacterized protein N7462_003074 [Penicillium macrosclerotiorum]KAJ5688682.1 hypothetical protein N7462_003074 [Penicillium macrosclerotiorum]
MAQPRGERPFSFQNLLKMLLTPNSSSRPAHDDADLAEDLDEPPDQHVLHATPMHKEEGIVFARPAMVGKESLLTRALKSSPEMSPTEPHPALHDSAYTYRSYPHSNISGISTAELTSDGGLTSPSLSNTPSPPLPPQMMGKHTHMHGKKDTTPKVKVVDTNETTVEANLGRKRCISFACGRRTEDSIQVKPAAPPRPEPQPTSTTTKAPEAPLRRTTLTFVCPGRQLNISRERSPGRKSVFRNRCRGSPAPVARKPSVERVVGVKEEKLPAMTTPPKGVPTSGLGKFEESEATRFHEFASSVDEDDEWVTKSTEYPEKITLNDCMKKENAIRQLGEEAEQEAQDEEDDEDEDDDIEDLADDDSTVHFSDDDGNESDNEAGFAESDEEDDDGSDYEFWAPSAVSSDSNAPTLEVFPPPTTMERRASNTSFDSMTDDHHTKWLPAPVRRIPGRRPSKGLKMRPGTPNLPDSTDFVCGTLDEDRPLEAAYKSCLEQRRLSKHVLIPQDIDPSFPTSDPEDNEDLEDISQGDLDDFVFEPARGRTDGQPRKPSPRHSPKRMMSPPPRRTGRTSPKRLKSPPPRVRAKSPSPETWAVSEEMPTIEAPRGVNISHLVQRRPLVRTKSLPRTPNPFFTSLEKSQRWQGIPPLTESPEREHSRTRELHTRGPIDIVEGLEKKRQKRKEKFWRQHCRKAAKEQAVRRPIPGKGAERMKELGLEVAERCRAYGVGQDAQLVLSV